MARGTIKNWWTRSVKITVIWSICGVIFFCFFMMALRNSSSLQATDSNMPTNSAGSSISNAEQRSILYAKMAKDLDENGAAFLKQGETSQSLSLSDLFTLKDGTISPVLRAANPPVRANVLHLSTHFSVAISDAVKNIFLPYFGEFPVPATESEIEAEASAVKAVAGSICPLHIILDRVVLTSTGVLLGCWQVVSGEDPVNIRAKLKAALPRAPQQQLYTEAMLHTSFARLLGHPKRLSEEENKMSELHLFHDLVSRLNAKIRGLKATVSELWYVEEYDLLALALNGKMKIRAFNLGCSEA